MKTEGRFTIYDLGFTSARESYFCNRNSLARWLAFVVLMAYSLTGLAATGPSSGGGGTNISYTTNLAITMIGSNMVAAGSGAEVATNSTASNVVFTISSRGTNANTLWVDKSGTIGLRARPDRPFVHPNHAWSNAVAGDTVVVMPGTYHGCSNLMKSGVNWVGIGWPTMTYTNRTNDRGAGIFDERFSGATTSVISGFNFVYSTGQPGGTNADGTGCCWPTNIAFAGVLVVTNPTSMVDFNFGDIAFMSIPEFGGSQCLNIQNTALTRIRGRSMRDMFYSSNYFVGLTDIGDSADRPSSAEGLYYEEGRLYVDIDDILMTKFSIFAQCPVAALARTNVLTANFGNVVGSCELFALATNPPNWITRITVKSLTGSTNPGTLGASTGVGYQITGGGDHELNAGVIANGQHNAPAITIAGDTSGAIITATPRVQINANKVTFQTGVRAYGDAAAFICSVAAGNVKLNVQEWEDTGGAMTGLHLSGGDTTVSGGRLTVTNGVGVRVGIGATARLRGLTIDTSTTSFTTNFPLIVATNGLILKDCVLVAPAAAPGIMAVGAQSVLAYNGGTGNKTNHPNVTVLAGPWTVDSSVK